MVRADLVRVVRFAVFEPRSPGLVCMTHFLDLLKHNDVAVLKRGGGVNIVLIIFNQIISMNIYYDH